ncbi:hypothetical protein JCM10049v2_007502 [Rhodotorula toruloides]
MLSLARLSFVLLLCIDATFAWPEGPQARRLVVDLEKRSTQGGGVFVGGGCFFLYQDDCTHDNDDELSYDDATSSNDFQPDNDLFCGSFNYVYTLDDVSSFNDDRTPFYDHHHNNEYDDHTCLRGDLPRWAFHHLWDGGQQLTLNGGNFRIAGPNIYWLCQDENSGPAWGYWTDKGRVREALAIAVAMGANTVRLMSCGVSVGSNNPYNLELSNGNWQDVAWDIRDYVIYAAGQYGLRIVLPLTDNYNYYHGGKYSILGFSGASTANKGAAFYTDSNTINIYKAYIQKFLQHTNVYNGKRYADDPTILAWETGNELGGYMNAEMWPPSSWTSAIVSAIKAVDGNHLIIDGTNGIWNYTTGATPAGLNVAGIDIVSDHSYPRKTDILSKELGIASAAKKGFLIGEFDWTAAGGGVSLPTYMSAIEQSGSYLGSMMWSVFGHDAQCCNYVTHNDGYSLYYPQGPNSAADQSNALLVVQHFYRLTGRSPPSSMPGVACPQPVF